MGGRAAVVQRRGRSDREVVGRLQCAPDRGAPPARAARNRDGVLDRRPLCGRRALHGRVSVERQPLVGRRVLPALRAASRPGARRLGVALALAGAARGGVSASAALARAPAARRLLAPGLGLRGLRRDRVPRVRGGRLGRRLLQRDPAPARGTLGAAQRPGRALGTRLPARGRTRPRDRIPPGRARVVERLPARRARARRRPPVLPRLDARERRRSGKTATARAAGSPRRAGRPIASSRACSTSRAIASARPARPRGSRSARRRRPAAPRAAGSWRRRAISARTMPTRCASTRSRFASAPRCWARPSCGWSSRPISRPAFVAARLCDVAPDGSSTRVSYGLWNLTHAPDHAAWAPLAPGRRCEVRFRLNDVALRVSRRTSAAARALERLLAAGLALAGARDAAGLHRSVPARAADPAARSRRRAAPRVRAARGAPRTANGRRSASRASSGAPIATRPRATS